ncbi:flagellar hook-length control protein FliK [uncultured Shewanella sp.]|uniref:flagellar hook-length control protein FliK n=1 Tax=uncultured Shewanella sp. TaxID=173975 RepID=UPI00262C7D56|nr:flagellar hook-length control protein FliK [uncultured Shewanella sp.]
MINNMPNLASFTSSGTSSSQQAFRPFDSDNSEHGAMGFVMPESQTQQSGLATSASPQSAVMSSIPEHLMVELKQHPQLFNALQEQITLAAKSDVGTAASFTNQAHFSLNEFGLSSLTSAQAKPLSAELSALLANLNQQTGKTNPHTSMSMQGTQSSPSSMHGNSANGLASNSLMQNSMPTSDFQVGTQTPMSFATTVSGQTHFQPAVVNSINAADAANAELDSINQVINQLTQTNTKSQTVSQWGPVSVTQSAPMLQQANEMMSPLRDQLRFQIDQQIKSAELRLDPPELGKVELNIRLDGDRLHVQMHAANPAVRDALLMGLDRLRMELAMDHGGQIDVDMGQSQSEQHTQRQQVIPNQENKIAFQSSEQHQATELTKQDQVDLLA